jgi:hypothetical protein
LYYDATVVFPSLSALVVSSKIFELWSFSK